MTFSVFLLYFLVILIFLSEYFLVLNFLVLNFLIFVLCVLFVDNLVMIGLGFSYFHILNRKYSFFIYFFLHYYFCDSIIRIFISRFRNLIYLETIPKVLYIPDRCCTEFNFFFHILLLSYFIYSKILIILYSKHWCLLKTKFILKTMLIVVYAKNLRHSFIPTIYKNFKSISLLI